ncbi:nucleoside diphosphate kinase regulator [Marinimicrobium sp. ABcell2]|uniref:nucleoside diphosphate kinase regulator n=1 Tax=Marinimicrobium sp. ABcell2 TaxID=3069751 RepID=UPI0027B67BC7|nr:nucleoside diphosphate kinase regulator [Marinimicrobium sp. ABcell2]MDQ2077779.1 nucleoside diphosphate kinase regulator [Marinimicrobium sp. ABcell2]
MLAKPEVTVSSDDYARLYALLESMPDSPASERLMDELERAAIVEREQVPPNVVTMHSKVTFTILSTNRTFTYRLVYPHETTGDDTLSVLTPVGSALIGLSVGQEIEWPVNGQKTTLVRLDSIEA